MGVAADVQAFGLEGVLYQALGPGQQLGEFAQGLRPQVGQRLAAQS